ncbi:MAG: sugar phosphate isomerase/epimerase family protein [Chloroflexota bacterium]
MTRKIGIEIFYWLENWSDDQVATMQRAKDCGFETVEISLVAGPDIDTAAYRTQLDRLSLDVYCSMGLPEDKDITSADASIRQAGIEYLKRCAETAQRVGSPVLCGLPYVPWLHFPETNDLRPYRDRAAAAMHDVAKAADNLGITVCMEIINRFETYIFNTVADGLDFIKQVDHPAVKLQLDTYHMNMEEDNIAQAIRLAGDKIGHFHCAASNRKMPGKGHINWSEVRQALDAVNYDGGILIETFPNPNSETGRTINAWRPLVEDFDEDAIAALAFLRKVFN